MKVSVLVLVTAAVLAVLASFSPASQIVNAFPGFTASVISAVLGWPFLRTAGM